MSRTKNTLNTHTVKLLPTIKDLAQQDRSINYISQKTGLSRFTVTKIVKLDYTIKIVEENKYVNESLI
jgi:hypothetical protein